MLENIILNLFILGAFAFTLAVLYTAGDLIFRAISYLKTKGDHN